MAANSATPENEKRSPYSRFWSAVFALGALVAIASLFWFIGAHHESAGSAGWGDQQQNRRHAFLAWGIVASAMFAAGLTLLAAPSRRVLFSLVAGATLSGLAVLIGPQLPWAGAILGGPGILASFFRFGPHSSGPDAYGFTINTIVYSIVIFLLIPKKKHPEEKSNEWWPEKRA